jgi:Gram-negative bacterial TonB protein C-terminal
MIGDGDTESKSSLKERMMIARLVVGFGIAFALCSGALAQTQAPWPCRDEIRKSDANALFIRVSDRATNKLGDNRVLPDISGLKAKDVDSVVLVQIIAGTDGAVRCFRLQEGDADLAQRSLDAAQKWHYRPYIVNGQAINVETWIRFSYKKDNVEVILRDR